MWASCILQSDTHIIELDSLNLLQSEELNIRAVRIDGKRLRAHVRAPIPSTRDEHLHHAHHAIKALVLSLNVGSFGHFYWESGPWAHPILTLSDNLDGAPQQRVALVTEPVAASFGEPRPFSQMDEYRSVLLFGVFARGSAHVLESEYCRGLLLFRMQFCDIDFRRDAFMCFYRVLEHFLTRRVLGRPRLQNELKDIQSCIRQLGLGEDIVDEMKELYLVRGSQTAHAQNLQRQITADEVMKIKVFVDAILFKILLNEANEIMERRQGARADG